MALLAACLMVALCFAGAGHAYAGVAIDDSVKLDPFDPVPQIGFHHDGCYDECGRRGCDHECGYRHRGCERDCYRHSWCGAECGSWHCCYKDCGRDECRNGWGCETGCRELRRDEIEALEHYRHQAEQYDAAIAAYMEQLCWYDARYHRWDGHVEGCKDEHWRDIHARDGWHDADHHDGPPPPDGGHDGDHHDGDHHDGDHHDGDHHDGPPPPDGWHDGDHHDGDHHDGDHHDGDHHDGDHHDGWRDHDGNWHDGPPPDGYPH
jgi:hypothetical protein